ncbi:MAG TPA: sugar ABC transporter ATP-binding protein [Vicinamibacterales bacterium]|nr:sugar ABC transporter ATP-binding protein [Vicinamibacterales bacterium]
MSALEFLDVRKSFGAVQALRGVSFRVDAGEAHAVVGENGAGKSTLLKILAGITRPDAGQIVLGGRPFDHASPREALAAGVGMVFQERLEFPNLSVTANIFAGREITRAFGRLDEAAMRARTESLLRDLRVGVSPDLQLAHASAANAQLVQVARALAFDCRVLVLDEPTTSLTDAEVDHLFKILFELKARGVTLLFVSHRLPEVFRLCDRITVLRDGSHAGTFDRAGTTPAVVVRAMVGREPPARTARTAGAPDQPPILSVRDVSRAGAFRNVSFELRSGEIVGVFGLVGSGRTEVLETVFGIARASGGRMEVAGQAYAPASPRDAMRAGVALVPEDRQRLGLHFNLNLRHNLALAAGARAGFGRLDSGRERARAGELVQSLAIKTTSVERSPDTLSGGNQQKVATGKWLATDPKILLLDEPTKGVDVGAKFEIHNLIRARANAGMACLMVSSDLPEVLALADRILVMREGELRGALAGATATEEAVMQLATHDESEDGGRERVERASQRERNEREPGGVQGGPPISQ